MSKVELKINKEYADLTPNMTIEEYVSLRQSIEIEGLKQKIIVNKNYEILDGHHRYTVLTDLKRDVTTDDIEIKDLSPEEERKYVFAVNIIRRHLKAYQKFLAGIKFGIWSDIKKKYGIENESSDVDIETLSDRTSEYPSVKARSEFGQIIGVSGGTLIKCFYVWGQKGYDTEKRILSEGDGELKIDKLYNDIRKDKAVNEGLPEGEPEKFKKEMQIERSGKDGVSKSVGYQDAKLDEVKQRVEDSKAITKMRDEKVEGQSLDLVAKVNEWINKNIYKTDPDKAEKSIDHILGIESEKTLEDFFADMFKKIEKKFIDEEIPHTKGNITLPTGISKLITISSDGYINDGKHYFGFLVVEGDTILTRQDLPIDSFSSFDLAQDYARQRGGYCAGQVTLDKKVFWSCYVLEEKKSETKKSD